MPAVSTVHNQLEEVARRTRSSRTGTGRSSSQGGRNVIEMLEATQRQGRLVSQPDSRVVEGIRHEERARGGPSAPRNSMDDSVQMLDELEETIDIVVRQSVEGNWIVEDDLSVIEDTYPEVLSEYQGVPPVSPREIIVPDDQHSDENEIEEETIAVVETTIDLTDSPPRTFLPLPSLMSPDGSILADRPFQSPGSLTPPRPSSRILSSISPPRSLSPQTPRPMILSPQPSTDQSPMLAQPVSDIASLKCPVCLEPFQSICRRGSNIVSTVCGHVFCGKCLPACVRISGHCPTCRRKIGYDDFHSLYLF